MQKTNAASAAKTRVFADTNVILEAFRTNCWTAISSHFAIKTVEKCVEETLTGNPGDPRHVSVPPADLNAGLSGRHPVTRKELVLLVLAHHSCAARSTTVNNTYWRGCLPTNCYHPRSLSSPLPTRRHWWQRTASDGSTARYRWKILLAGPGWVAPIWTRSRCSTGRTGYRASKPRFEWGSSHNESAR